MFVLFIFVNAKIEIFTNRRFIKNHFDPKPTIFSVSIPKITVRILHQYLSGFISHLSNIG